MFTGERQLHDIKDDALGFAEPARNLAKSLRSTALKDGIVIGIEGKWGSGKSTYVNFAVGEFVSEAVQNTTPLLIRFNPWLIGDRDALLRTLFEELARAVAKLEHEQGDATGVTKTSIQDLSNTLKKFGRRLAPLQHVAGLAELIVPGAGAAKEIVKTITDLSADTESDVSLVDLKEKLNKGLEATHRRIIVIIDDLDRLEPKEIMEILRLVRSVADFSNVTYLLCYDRNVIAHAVRVSIGLQEDADRFLEKIIQLEIKIPEPEPSALPRVFRSKLAELIPNMPEQAGYRLQWVLNRWGRRYLKTPRIVSKVINALRFAWPSLEGKVDPADYVWLQLLRHGNPAYYEWVEAYVADVSTRHFDRNTQGVSDHIVRLEVAKLVGILDDEQEDTADESFALSFLLPRCIRLPNKGSMSWLYVNGPPDHEAITASRLASPHHYRLYFAGNLPDNSAHEIDLTAMIEAAGQSGDAVVAMVRRLGGEARLSVLPSVLDRLPEAFSIQPPTPLHLQHMFEGFASIMDQPSVASIAGYDWDEPNIWTDAGRLLVLLRQEIKTTLEVVVPTIEQGKALGWITMLIRREMFAHGVAGDDLRHQSEHIMSSETFKEATEALLIRLRNMTAVELTDTPAPDFLFATWCDLSDDCVEVEDYLAKLDDKTYVAIIQKLSDRRLPEHRRILERSETSKLDYFAAELRIRKIASNIGQPNYNLARTVLRQLEADALQ